MLKNLLLLPAIFLVYGCATESPDKLCLRAVSYKGDGDYANALQCYTKAIDKLDKQGNDNGLMLGRTLIQRASIFQATGRYSEALSDLNKAANIDAEERSRIHLYGAFICKSMGDQKQALTYYDAAVAEIPRLVGWRQDNDIFTLRGDLKRRQKNYAEAILDYNRALTSDFGKLENDGRDVIPAKGSTSLHAVHVYYWKGVCREHIGDNGATEDYRRTIEFAQRQLAQPPAATPGDKIVRLDPVDPLYTKSTNGMMHFYKGLAERRLGQSKQAEEDLTASQRLGYTPSPLDFSKNLY